MASTIYLGRLILSSSITNLTVLSQPGDITDITWDFSANVSPVQGNTLDGSTSGFCYGNRLGTLNFTGMVRQDDFFSNLLSIDPSSQEFDITVLGPAAGGSYPNNFVPLVTLISCAPSNQSAQLLRIGSPVEQKFSVYFTDISYFTTPS